jgi:hypothetical protein
MFTSLTHTTMQTATTAAASTCTQGVDVNFLRGNGFALAERCAL